MSASLVILSKHPVLKTVNNRRIIELCLAEMTEEQRKEFPEFGGIQSIKVVI